MILLIDNYDSFTHNLSRYFQELDQAVVIKRNDAFSVADIWSLDPRYIVISPGPKGPPDAGLSLDVIRAFSGHIPILGVCLGHQCIGHGFGATIKRAPRPMHGKVSPILHRGTGLFKGLRNFLPVMRYHSLVIDQETLPPSFLITAETNEGDIMAIAHKTLPLAGVQFHPESVLTEGGHQLLLNFINGHYR